MKSFEDDPASDQGQFDDMVANSTDDQINDRADAVIRASVAADACRASLSQGAQEVLGSHIPESFFTEVYPRRFEMLDKNFASEVAEIRAAIGRSEPSYWDFGTMTTKELFAADPRTIKPRNQNATDQGVLPTGDGSAVAE